MYCLWFDRFLQESEKSRLSFLNDLLHTIIKFLKIRLWIYFYTVLGLFQRQGTQKTRPISQFSGEQRPHVEKYGATTEATTGKMDNWALKIFL